VRLCVTRVGERAIRLLPGGLTVAHEQEA
jgi:hypothetical protein